MLSRIVTICGRVGLHKATASTPEIYKYKYKYTGRPYVWSMICNQVHFDYTHSRACEYHRSHQKETVE